MEQIKRPEDNSLLFQPPVKLERHGSSGIDFLTKKISVYVHIPYCERKCGFCSIETCMKFSDQDINDYVDAMVKEILYYQDHLRANKVECIHFGGGTPSLLNEKQLSDIFNALSKCIKDFDNVEIVFESNPLSLSDDKIDYLAQHPNMLINLGIQTFDDKLLKLTNRGSSYKLIYNRLNRIKSKKLRSIGIDLICNLPFSDEKTTLKDIDEAVSLGINHMALYPLRLEQDSIFFSNYEKYMQGMKDDELQLSTFTNAKAYLRSKGYDHYSIYHFDNQMENSYLYGRNQMYGGEWIGLGAGAYSSYNGCTFTNSSNISEYIRLCNQEKSCIAYKQMQNPLRTLVWEFLFSLRITKIKEMYYKEKYGEVIYNEYILKLINHLKAKGYLESTHDFFSLTQVGVINLGAVEKEILGSYEKLLIY